MPGIDLNPVPAKFIFFACTAHSYLNYHECIVHFIKRKMKYRSPAPKFEKKGANQGIFSYGLKKVVEKKMEVKKIKTIK